MLSLPSELASLTLTDSASPRAFTTSLAETRRLLFRPVFTSPSCSILHPLLHRLLHPWEACYRTVWTHQSLPLLPAPWNTRSGFLARRCVSYLPQRHVGARCATQSCVSVPWHGRLGTAPQHLRRQPGQPSSDRTPLWCPCSETVLSCPLPSMQAHQSEKYGWCFWLRAALGGGGGLWLRKERFFE